MPEFQGRLPVRVELQPLTEKDLYRIMTQTEKNIIQQQTEMLKTEKYILVWEDSAIREIARL
jgi:ATP-dependent HslUV protease ATP-binding subunit HslU